MKKKKIFIFIFLLLIFISLFIISYDYLKTEQDIIYNEINAKFYKNKKTTTKKKKENNQDVISNIKIDENVTELEESNINNNPDSNYDSNIVAVLEIPQINLTRNLYNKNSSENTISKNVKIMNESDFPNIKKGNFILAAHSGTGRLAFFKDLHNLSLSSMIYVYFNGVKYSYEINNIYDEDKDGNIAIKRNINETTITLITCKYKDKTKQTVYTGVLKNEENL